MQKLDPVQNYYIATSVSLNVDRIHMYYISSKYATAQFTNCMLMCPSVPLVLQLWHTEGSFQFWSTTGHFAQYSSASTTAE